MTVTEFREPAITLQARTCYLRLPNSTVKQSGYLVGITVDQLKDAPTFGAGETPAWGDRAYETRIHDHYKTAPYWGVAGL